MISRVPVYWFRSKDILCHHDLLGSRLLVRALKIPFAVMISWFRSTGFGTKEALCHHDLLVPVYWLRR